MCGVCGVCGGRGYIWSGGKGRAIFPFEETHTFFVRGERFDHSDKLQEHLQDGPPMASLERKTMSILY